MQQTDDITFKMVGGNKTGMVSPPQVASRDKKTTIQDSIKAILDLEYTCKETEKEVLCDECPFDLDYECGLHLLRAQAEKIKMEMGIGMCPDCGTPATHPSGLCRDCYQAKLERNDVQ